jgi:L-ribulose-5-phosphate 3-epimerase
MNIDRRALLQGTGAAVAASLIGSGSEAQEGSEGMAKSRDLKLKFAVGYGMIAGGGSVLEKFHLARKAGFEGIEINCPNPFSDEEVVRAVAESGIPVHSVVDSVHWHSTLSHADPAERDRGIVGLEAAIRGAKAYGASDVLLVPAVVGGEVTEEQAWERSIAGIRQVLPIAAELGIFILIENVWNRFGYDHDGGAQQSAGKLADYIDAIDSPWVRFYLDLGNHRKYADVEEWVRTLGSRIVKLHAKGWGKANGWCDIGEGDVNWPEVCKALREIGYTGWVTAEVGGGDGARLAQIKAQMDDVFSH